ncbi:coiled-coil domain-containing protein 38 isoform X2 [Microcebus murinus]|uniref:Coiled-coil domain containing 38 n=1 Tax=Microcebus murinus TaxID=30608 RepID=A0A8B7X8J5_MICMU|nr:coiled-coil domain-containing protein 38 [Microcebus murinus]
MSSNVLPTPPNSEDKVKDDSVKKDRPYKIFFKDLFLYKENEMATKRKEKVMNSQMKIHQKTTFSSRMKSRSHLRQLAFRSDTTDSFEKFGLDPAIILRLTDGSDSKRTVHDFINDQRDRFLLEYTLSAKRNTIQMLEESMVMKEKELAKAEKKLQDDSMAFEEFLRENDQRSVDALKMAAQETMNKLQMTAELKKASMDLQAVKSEIAKTEFLLNQYMKYGVFLLRLSPKHWQMEQALKKTQATHILPKLVPRFSSELNKKDTLEDPRQTLAISEDSFHKSSEGKSPRRKSILTPEKMKSAISNQAESMGSEDSLDLFSDDMDFDLDPVLYFKEPEELLQVLTELEEQNLTLVQYSQDVDENLDDVNKREKVIKDKINTNIDFLLEHKELLKANCEREEEKAAELELRSRLFSFGEFNSDAQEKLIDSLSKKINQVYKVCIGDSEVGSLTAVQKLVKVESRLGELSDLIEGIPKDSMEAIERIKQKERRQRLRDEKMREKLRHQEERLKAALERAVSQPKKKLGRRLVYRSVPPSDNKHKLILVSDTRAKTQEEEYFFT